MSSARRKQTGREPTFPPSDQTDRIPTETPSTVYLKTLMEIKEDIGGIKSDLKKLKDDVEDVKGKQADIDKTIASIKTIFKTVLTIAGLLATILTLIRYWPVLQATLQ